MVRQLRADGADVIICMSHGGIREPETGPITEGEDIDLARAVPEIDVIVGGHTHTFVRTPIIAEGTPVVQAGCYGQALGELVVRMEGHERKVAFYQLHTIDDAIPVIPASPMQWRGSKLTHRASSSRLEASRLTSPWP
jgi:5'-nucleotidase / UDP-sugar diphosphatase